MTHSIHPQRPVHRKHSRTRLTFIRLLAYEREPSRCTQEVDLLHAEIQSRRLSFARRPLARRPSQLRVCALVDGEICFVRSHLIHAPVAELA